MRTKGDGKGQNGGGRKKGTVNKTTAVMRELLKNFCEETFEEFKMTFHMIDEPKDKCKIWLDIQSFVTPKLTSVDLKDNTQGKSFSDEIQRIREEKNNNKQ